MRTHKGTHSLLGLATVSLVIIACGGSDTSDFAGATMGTAGAGTAGTAGTQGGGGSSSVSGSGGTSAGGDNATGGDMGTGGNNGTSGAGGMSVAAGSSGAGGGAGSPSTDAGGAVCAGKECAAFAGALAAAPRGATALSNCVIQIHQLDCCGARAAYGVNHGARTTLCPAETTCVATYVATKPCTDTTIKTDTGETTMTEADVKLRCVPGGATCTCETFVCKNDGCRAAPGIAGGCGQ